MIDLHSHFLYGVDDGPSTIKDSFELLKQAEQAGITQILATPHYTDRSTERDRATIFEIFKEIKKRLPEYDLHLEIQLAAEVYHSPEMLNWLDQSWLLIGSKQHYLLFDIPMQMPPPDLAETIFQLGRRKVIPILAHPERNGEVQKKPQLLAEWIRLGCIMQMDAGSLTGKFGRRCQRTSRQLLNDGLIHLIASDAHDCTERNFNLLVQARSIVEKKYGLQLSRLLFFDNPRRIWAGEQLMSIQPPAATTRVNMIRQLSGAVSRVFFNAHSRESGNP